MIVGKSRYDFQYVFSAGILHFLFALLLVFLQNSGMIMKNFDQFNNN
jgi:hypothetical protein